MLMLVKGNLFALGIHAADMSDFLSILNKGRCFPSDLVLTNTDQDPVPLNVSEYIINPNYLPSTISSSGETIGLANGLIPTNCTTNVSDSTADPGNPNSGYVSDQSLISTSSFDNHHVNPFPLSTLVSPELPIPDVDSYPFSFGTPYGEFTFGEQYGASTSIHTDGYLGCYATTSGSVQSSHMTVKQHNGADDLNTPSRCRYSCREFKHFALHNGNKCLCTNVLATYDSNGIVSGLTSYFTQLAGPDEYGTDSFCTTDCSLQNMGTDVDPAVIPFADGTRTVKCGSSSYYSFYSVSLPSYHYDPTDLFVGCYSDEGRFGTDDNDRIDRSLPIYLLDGTNHDVNSCRNYCLTQSQPDPSSVTGVVGMAVEVAAPILPNLWFFGLQNNGECFCGNKLMFHPLNSTLACSNACTSNSNDKCGAGHSNRVYGVTDPWDHCRYRNTQNGLWSEPRYPISDRMCQWTMHDNGWSGYCDCDGNASPHSELEYKVNSDPSPTQVGKICDKECMNYGRCKFRGNNGDIFNSSSTLRNMALDKECDEIIGGDVAGYCDCNGNAVFDEGDWSTLNGGETALNKITDAEHDAATSSMWNFTFIHVSSTPNTYSAIAECPEGTYIYSGGCDTGSTAKAQLINGPVLGPSTYTATDDGSTQNLFPDGSSTATAWQCSSGDTSASVTSYAICTPDFGPTRIGIFNSIVEAANNRYQQDAFCNDEYEFLAAGGCTSSGNGYHAVSYVWQGVYHCGGRSNNKDLKLVCASKYAGLFSLNTSLSDADALSSAGHPLASADALSAWATANSFSASLTGGSILNANGGVGDVSLNSLFGDPSSLSEYSSLSNRNISWSYDYDWKWQHIVIGPIAVSADTADAVCPSSHPIVVGGSCDTWAAPNRITKSAPEHNYPNAVDKFRCAGDTGGYGFNAWAHCMATGESRSNNMRIRGPYYNSSALFTRSTSNDYGIADYSYSSSATRTRSPMSFRPSTCGTYCQVDQNNTARLFNEQRFGWPAVVNGYSALYLQTNPWASETGGACDCDGDGQIWDWDESFEPLKAKFFFNWTTRYERSETENFFGPNVTYVKKPNSCSIQCSCKRSSNCRITDYSELCQSPLSYRTCTECDFGYFSSSYPDYFGPPLGGYLGSSLVVGNNLIASSNSDAILQTTMFGQLEWTYCAALSGSCRCAGLLRMGYDGHWLPSQYGRRVYYDEDPLGRKTFTCDSTAVASANYLWPATPHCECAVIPDTKCQECKDVLHCANPDFDITSIVSSNLQPQVDTAWTKSARTTCVQALLNHTLVLNPNVIAAVISNMDANSTTTADDYTTTDVYYSYLDANSNLTVQYVKPCQVCQPGFGLKSSGHCEECIVMPGCVESYFNSSDQGSCILADHSTGKNSYLHGNSALLRGHIVSPETDGSGDFSESTIRSRPLDFQNYLFCSKCDVGYFFHEGFCVKSQPPGTVCEAHCALNKDVISKSECVNGSSADISLIGGPPGGAGGNIANSQGNTAGWTNFTSAYCGQYCVNTSLPSSSIEIVDWIADGHYSGSNVHPNYPGSEHYSGSDVRPNWWTSDAAIAYDTVLSCNDVRYYNEGQTESSDTMLAQTCLLSMALNYSFYHESSYLATNVTCSVTPEAEDALRRNGRDLYGSVSTTGLESPLIPLLRPWTSVPWEMPCENYCKIKSNPFDLFNIRRLELSSFKLQAESPSLKKLYSRKAFRQRMKRKKLRYMKNQMRKNNQMRKSTRDASNWMEGASYATKYATNSKKVTNEVTTSTKEGTAASKDTSTTSTKEGTAASKDSTTRGVEKNMELLAGTEDATGDRETVSVKKEAVVVKNKKHKRRQVRTLSDSEKSEQSEDVFEDLSATDMKHIYKSVLGIKLKSP